MAESRIFLKDSLLKTLPSSISFRDLPVLFAEAGLMTDTKGTKEKCSIVVYLSGIAFLVHKLGHWKLLQFMSTYDITDIVFVDSKQREIVTKYGPLFFNSPHMDCAIGCLLAAREALFLGCLHCRSIELTNFKTMPPMPKVADLVNKDNISYLRYLCACVRYLIPADDQISEFMRGIDKQTSTTLVVDKSCDNCGHVHCLILPIILGEKFTEVVFRRTMPYGVCRVVHFLLKSSLMI
jgi:hypothetical protein